MSALPDARQARLCDRSVDVETEDEMLRKLVNKTLELHDVLEEQRQQTEDAKLAEAIKTNRARLKAQTKKLAQQTAAEHCKVTYTPGPDACPLPAGSPASSSSASSSSSAPSPTEKKKRVSKPNGCRQNVDYELEQVSKLPAAAVYIYTPRNVLVEDQKALPNIPYFDDVTASEDNAFIKEVISCYGNRIHAEAEIKGDEQLVQLVDKLFETPGASSCKVFQAISSAFPDEGSKEDVKKRYDRLKSSKGRTSFNPNIDSPLALSCSRERSLHSFKTLFCRRCLMYDCLLHSVEMDLSQEQAVKAAIRNKDNFNEYNPKLETKACSDSCYLLRRDYGSGIGAPDIHLPPAAESLIRCEWNSSPGNFCFLTELVPAHTPPVTCSMIYYWCKKEFDNFDILVGEDRKVSSKPTVVVPNNPSNNVSSSITIKIEDDDEHDENCSNPDLNAAGSANGVINKSKRKKAPKGWTKKRNKYTTWQMKAAMVQGKVKDLTPGTVHNYTPCLDHTVCSAATCHCIEKGHFCEKYCLCSVHCPYKFPGCNCNGTCNTKQCPCFAASRECDPDLCKTCGSGDLPEAKKCANVDLQRMHKKHLLVAPSDLGPDAGWGCYLKERCDKNDLISEYVGEQISQAEADRRGLIYDRKKHSFLFCLNSDFSVDATRYGNKIRFANHSVNPNCFAKIMKVNGEHRIGIYAKRDIEKNEELFFDYKYGPNERIEFVPIESSGLSVQPRVSNGFRGKSEKL